MGRANRKQAELGSTDTATRREAASSPEEAQLREFERLVMPLSTRMLSAATGKDDAERADAARATAVRKLSQDTQVELINAAQLAGAYAAEFKDSDDPQQRALAHRAHNISQRAREVFVYCHTGYVVQQVRKNVAAFESEGRDGQGANARSHAQNVLMQEARMGLLKTVDDYNVQLRDPNTGELVDNEASPLAQAVNATSNSIKGKPDASTKQANPLTFGAWKVKERVAEAKEQGPLITAKSRAFDDRGKVEKAVKAIQNRGDTVTLAEVEKLSGVPAARSSELLRTISPKARLDAPISTSAEGEDTLGTIIPEEAAGTEERILDDAERDVARDEVSKLKPFHRRVVEFEFNLTGSEDVEQKHLYDGVYYDNDGNAFSSEGTVINDRKRHGQEVAKASQKELESRFRDGELVFEAGTPESFELARLKLADQLERSGTVLPDVPRQEMLDRIITAETGMPMTSGQIQNAKEQAMFELSQRKELAALKPRYRGDHELENSVQARKIVRRALVAVGDLDAERADATKAGRAARDGSHKPGELVKMARERGWVDESTGRVRWNAIKESVSEHKRDVARNTQDIESTEELGELMAQA